MSGSVEYGPEQLDKPAEGNLLICCARPAGDVVVDLVKTWLAEPSPAAHSISRVMRRAAFAPRTRNLHRQC